MSELVYVADEDEDWPPRETLDTETGVSRSFPPPSGIPAPDAHSRTGREPIAQMMEKWAAKLSPAEQRQWREHGTFIGWEMPKEGTS